MPHFRPFAASLPAFAAVVIMMLVGTLQVDYNGTTLLSSYRVGPWFVLGFPFVVLLALAYAAVVALLARKKRWFPVAIAASLLLAVAVWNAYGRLPKVAAASILRGNVASRAVVHRLHEIPSFGDGTIRYGALSGPAELLQSILRANPSLSGYEIRDLRRLRDLFPEDSLPQFGAAYSDGRLTLYPDPKTGTIYFLRLPAPRVRAVR